MSAHGNVPMSISPFPCAIANANATGAVSVSLAALFTLLYNFQQFISFAVARYNTYNLHAKVLISNCVVFCKIQAGLCSRSKGYQVRIWGFLSFCIAIIPTGGTDTLYSYSTLPGLLPFPLLFACLF